jgi:hypothetical protein
MHSVSRTIADEIFARVEALTGADPGLTRAAAIRAVADAMGRSVSGTSSAFYSGARRAREAAATPPSSGGPRARRVRTSGHSDGPRLYAEMLPLVEAGATVEQAARRFGDDDSVAEIAAGFSRWVERDRLGAAEAPGARTTAAGSLQRSVDDAEARITSLEAENRTLRRDLTRARQALQRIRTIVDTASDLP